MHLSSLTPLHRLTGATILFPGQGSAWQKALAQAAAQPQVRTRLVELLESARTTTAPVARQIASTCPGVFGRLQELIDGEDNVQDADVFPAYSIPGIVLGQIAAVEHLAQLGLRPEKALGHSQGSLGVLALRDPQEALSLALVMGTAASASHGSVDARSHMLALRGLTREFVEERLQGDAAIAVVNGRRAFALSGSPDCLAATRAALEGAVDEYNATLAERTVGGDEIELLSLIHI